MNTNVLKYLPRSLPSMVLAIFIVSLGIVTSSCDVISSDSAPDELEVRDVIVLNHLDGAVGIDLEDAFPGYTVQRVIGEGVDDTKRQILANRDYLIYNGIADTSRFQLELISEAGEIAYSNIDVVNRPSDTCGAENFDGAIIPPNTTLIANLLQNKDFCGLTHLRSFYGITFSEYRPGTENEYHSEYRPEFVDEYRGSFSMDTLNQIQEGAYLTYTFSPPKDFTGTFKSGYIFVANFDGGRLPLTEEYANRIISDSTLSEFYSRHEVTIHVVKE